MQFFERRPRFEAFFSLACWPVDWARGVLARQSLVQRKLLVLVERPSRCSVEDFAVALWDWRASIAAVAFDQSRAQYAAGVQSGAIERSLLASAAFERKLSTLERLTLGPFGRTV